MNPATDPQSRIDTAIRQLGGYWPPLAGLARILEELAELASAQTVEDRRREAVDCVVAALAVANQYAVHTGAHEDWATGDAEREALIAAGHVARLVNRFEGSKPPKPQEDGAPPLPVVFNALVTSLARSAGMTTEEVMMAAASVAEANAERDAGRFAARTDAITAQSRDAYLEAFGTVGPGSIAGVWGIDTETPPDVINEIRRFLRVDAVHPLACLVAGPFADGDLRLHELWMCFQDNAPRGSLSKVATQKGIFIRLAGTR